MKTIEIDNRLYNSIVSYCEANAIEPMKYIDKALRERLATDKYGDLNEKFRKEEIPSISQEKTQTKPEPDAHIVVQEPLTEEVHIEKSYDVSEPGDFAKAMEEMGNEEKHRKKRILKTK